MRAPGGVGRAGRGVGDEPASALDRDRARRAHPDRFLHLGSELLGRLLLEDVEEVVVAHLEDLRRDAHAHGIARALVEVDHDLHGRSLLGFRAPDLTARGLAANLTPASYWSALDPDLRRLRAHGPHRIRPLPGR